MSCGDRREKEFTAKYIAQPAHFLSRRNSKCRTKNLKNTQQANLFSSVSSVRK